jgi:transcriptional regulator with XRE-family HTH domain
MSQRALAELASVPTTMISAYERDKRQPSLATLMRLLNAAGFELTMKLEPRDAHDDVLARLESRRSASERRRRDRQIESWRRARPVGTVP